MGALFSSKDKDKWKRICPSCRSENVSVDFSNAANVAYGGVLGYRCNSCGNTGSIFPEINKDKIKKLHIKNRGEKQFVNSGFQKGYTQFVAKILAPIYIISPLIMWITGETSVISIIAGMILLLMAIFMLYVGFFKERE